VSGGVLLMAYGSPATLDDVEAYYTHIRGGRPPSAAQVEALRERYRRIGGTSPLREITRRQADGVRAALARSGLALPVFVGMKHAPPFIEEVLGAMAGEGIREVVALALAPHYSRVSVAAYFTTARSAAAAAGIALRTVEHWHDHPGYIAAVSARLRALLRRCGDAGAPEVVFTAHSLPQRILSWDDPYPRQLRRTSELVAAATGLARWRFAYQSASPAGEPWLGPALGEVIEEVAAGGGRAIAVCPVGFVSDHLEVLYDIDIEARAAAAARGIRLERTPSLNDAPDFVEALADLVRGTLAGGRP